MNTKKQDQKYQGQKARPKDRAKARGRNSETHFHGRKHHEQELPETRMFR